MPLLPDYAFKTPPYNHQREALEKGWDVRGFAYLMDMGTGKTKTAIDNIAMLYQRGSIDTILVLSNKGSYAGWYTKEFGKHFPEYIQAAARAVLWRGGKTQQEKRALEELIRPTNSLRILVMNIEALSSSSGRAVNVAEAFLKSGKSMMIVDESTTIKNHSAQRTKNVAYLGTLAIARRILTGSPVTRSPLDLYSQFSFIKPGLLGSSYYSFRARYCVIQKKNFGGREVPLVVGYRNLEALTALIEPYMYRVLKEDCLDLPAKIYIQRDVELTDEQTEMYIQIKRKAYLVLEDDSEVSAMAMITQLLRMHQIVCGHITDDEGNVHDLPNNRIKELIAVLEETSGSVIIWCNYRRDVLNIMEQLQKSFPHERAVRYDGGVSIADCEKAIDSFQDGSSRFFVGTVSKGGYGITLTKAKTVIYYSNSYDLEKRSQSEDRAHRIGQDKSVTYVDLVCPGTVDERIIEALRSKIDIATTILGDGYKQWLI
jgi:SNF2 family DNA or RNA helicase